MSARSPWGSSLTTETDELPLRADVVVVGGGLAGLTCALRLAQSGVDVAVLEASSDLGQGAAGRGSGMAHLGLCEHPIQLAHAVGDADAEDLIRLSLHSLELLNSLQLDSSIGGIWCASMDREAEGIARSTRWLQARGVD